MRTQKLGRSELQVPRVALGCMRMANLSVDDAEKVIRNSMDLAINYFDHADIYGKGKSEEVFAQAMNRLNYPRNSYYLQSKCGIKPGAYDFSAKHLTESVDGILKRLETEYLDVLLLHRPDTLMEPDKIADVFAKLQQAGKVKHFGVSNFNSSQVALLQHDVAQPLVANQLQFGLMHTGMINQEFHVNMTDASSVDHDGGILSYSRLHEMTIQAWSPFQYGFFEGVFVDNPKFNMLNEALQKIADQYQVSKNAIVTAWVLRHPANIQMIAGTMNPERLTEIAAGSEFTLSHQEWYELYLAAGNKLP